MLILLLTSLVHAQDFNVTYQCRPETVRIYDDLGLRATHGSGWDDKRSLVGEGATYAAAVEGARRKVQDAFSRAREQAAELLHYTIADMICRKKIASGGGSWDVLFSQDNRMKYAPVTGLRDERVQKAEPARKYASEP